MKQRGEFPTHRAGAPAGRRVKEGKPLLRGDCKMLTTRTSLSKHLAPARLVR